LIVSIIITTIFWIHLFLSICVKHAMRHCCLIRARIINSTYFMTAIVTIHAFFYFLIRIFYWKSSPIFFVKICWIWWWVSDSFLFNLWNCCIIEILNIFWLEIVWNCLIFLIILLIKRINIFVLFFIIIYNIFVIFILLNFII
jgi:hypothetical protein